MKLAISLPTGDFITKILINPISSPIFPVDLTSF